MGRLSCDLSGTSRLATRLAALWVAIVLNGPAPVLSGPEIGLPPEPGPARTVKMFDLFCLGLLPDLAAIAEVAAAGGFTELSGDELTPYQPEVPADELRVWRFEDFDSEFTMAISKSKPDEQFKATVPEFADSVSYACSLITSGHDPKSAVLGEMSKLMGRDADETWEQGPLKVHAWTGQTDEMLTQVFHYAPIQGEATSLLAVTTFVKE